MTQFFNFLQDYRRGILVFFFSLAGIAAIVQWFAWIFGKGRFGRATSSENKTVSFIVTEASVKIINDFRHLLALIVVLIFAFALSYSLIRSASLPTGADSISAIDNMKEALQAVVASLGGLVGSIIGYYFGESSVSRAAEQVQQNNPPAVGPTPDSAPIVDAPEPPIKP